MEIKSYTLYPFINKCEKPEYLQRKERERNREADRKRENSRER